ncbi:Peptidase family M48 [Nonomuraea solani]|uniref:Peptidase family M48 n=1 Tax=Nonomuraea solani TaxID=1144553 RepID=A0A1H6EZ97_9ACTN|nr:M56 family metallopeptidase [Nonomuraea solani]SEH02189.1 Peptidase family M48 [Nonomuraea solani]
MTYAAHHVLTLLAALSAMAGMLRSRLPWRAPRTSLLIWQAIGLTLVLSVVGVALALGLAPYRLGIVPALAAFARDLAGGGLPGALTPFHLLLTACGIAVAGWVLAAFARSARSVAALRRRQRALLGLIARPHPEFAGALVVEHPAVAAYCVPGRRAAIVVSTGSLGLLTRCELRAVLAHERAHARERHDLVILPFAALHRALPASRHVRAMLDAVALLVEMRADDRAARDDGHLILATALRRFRTCDHLVSPPGTLAATEIGAGGDLDARIDRLSAPVPASTPVRVLLLAIAVTVVSTPISLFLLPV